MSFTKHISKAVTVVTLLFSMNVNAGIIDLGSGMLGLNGYTLDNSTGVITDGSLEWLQWSKTDGLSFNEAVLAYGSDWRLADSNELDSMLNSLLPIASWSSITFANTGLNYGSNSSGTDYPSNWGWDTHIDPFISFFGQTHTNGKVWSNHNLLDPSILSGAIYENGYFSVSDNSSEESGHIDRIGGKYYYTSNTTISGSLSNPTYGVALVRNVAEVPEPSTLAIFALGMMGLASRRFKKQS